MDNTKNKNVSIAIIGAGQLGSRHLQSLAILKREVTIQVVDPSKESLQRAKNIYDAVAEVYSNGVEYFEAINELNNDITVAIIATSSMPRRKIVEELLKTKKIQYLILEKVLFPRIEDYKIVGKLIKAHGCKAWVNCSRRMIKDLQNLKEELKDERFLQMAVLGNQWGLACNAIHFIDLFAYLSGNIDGYTYDISLLDEGFVDSKRKGYIEITGTLQVNSPKGNISISSFDGLSSPVTITIYGEKTQAIIFESQGEMRITKQEDGWGPKVRKFTLPYQSQLTSILIEAILNTGDCSLVTYEVSCKIHIPLIEAILKHINKCEREEKKLCPIT